MQYTHVLEFTHLFRHEITICREKLDFRLIIRDIKQTKSFGLAYFECCVPRKPNGESGTTTNEKGPRERWRRERLGR